MMTPATTQAIAKTLDIVILAIMGDKLMAEKQREISRVIQAAIQGEITDEEAVELLRPKLNDALDKVLGNP